DPIVPLDASSDSRVSQRNSGTWAEVLGRENAMLRKLLWKCTWPAPAALLPRLIVIGAQKAGTTALASYLAQHPQFLPSRVKEVNYFGCQPRYSNGPRWYASHWPKARSGRNRNTRPNVVRFEASPHYMRARHAASQLHECLA